VARAARPSAVATASRALQNGVLGAVNRARPAPAREQSTPAGRDDVETWFTAVEAVAGTTTAPLARRSDRRAGRQEALL
jgi:hypothetical protein